MNENLKDKYNRTYKYLRVSVTDRCNFRCKYCVPTHDFEFIPHGKILKYEDILFAVESLSKLGIEKIRLTGGEPLVRKNISYLISEIGKIKNIKETTLTTNGSLLSKYVNEIYDAGIRRINISLDSLREDRYEYITGGFKLNEILDGINKAIKTGLNPIKINVVAIKTFNDDEILDFCNFAGENNLNVRFIEFMPIGNNVEWKKEHIITGDEILKIISKKFTYEPVKKGNFEGPAVNYRLSNGAKIGIITPISNHFCSECDKLRLTADGKLRPCLLSDNEINLFDEIKSRDFAGFKEKIKESLKLKELDHNITNDGCTAKFKRTMSKIGG
ncbi:MAG: 3,8-cyclase [Deferribacteres bacterium]|nr:3,8-cyclase [Deferribacteres bacterium]